MLEIGQVLRDRRWTWFYFFAKCVIFEVLESRMETHMHWKDPIRELHDLFGHASWGQIRTHTNGLISLFKLKPALVPWGEEKASGLVNGLVDSAFTPSKPKRAMDTLNWIGSAVGLPLLDMEARMLEGS